jgi:photosystem II stability/assembly factor-like uncharacterized protein
MMIGRPFFFGITTMMQRLLFAAVVAGTFSIASANQPPKASEEKVKPALQTAGVHEPPDTEERPEPPKPGGPPVEFRYLQFRCIGPDIGGRACRSAGVPGDPLTYYSASSAGGLWKSIDGGRSWKSVFDEQPTSTCGSLAIAPSDPNILYVGSGEANIRGNVQTGNGIYKTVDGGKTWKHVWQQLGQIGTMIVHPTNPDIAFAAVLGNPFASNPERGVYRTRDGGKSWQQVLFKDADTGASDVCFAADNANVLFAGLWQARRTPWSMTSGGPGSGLYTSHDGGDTWQQITGHGLPKGIWGKIGVAVAPSEPTRVYALIEADKGGLYRSDDGGENWSSINQGHFLRQRAWYYSCLTVDPNNADVVWFPQVPMLKRVDGGATVKKVKGLHHGDNHDCWIDPKDNRRIIVSNDGGVDISTDGGKTWFSGSLPTVQFYHIDVDNRAPYYVSGTMQDWGTGCGPSNSLCAGGVRRGDWRSVGGGEAGYTAFDPSDPNIVYAGEYGGYISRYDDRSRQAHNISTYPMDPSGHGAEDLKYRFQWTAPILVSPNNPHTVYHASNVLFRTTDQGVHWSQISQDLTRNDKNKQKWSGGPITGDNTGVEYYGTIFAIAESPKESGLLWAGSDDGLVHVSRDGGQNWADVTANVPGLPEWSTIVCIEPSPYDAGTAYLVAEAHRLSNFKPYLYKTTDYGASWQSLAGKLAPDVYLHVVRADPTQKGTLFLGTEKGLQYSLDDGQNWRALKLNFPTAAVHDLRIKNNDLVVGTSGRSIWIFDDLFPIRHMSPAIAQADIHLFPTDVATRYRYFGAFDEKGFGKNPAPGVIIDYYLKQKPKSDISIDILDSAGRLVMHLDSKPEKDAISPDDPDSPDDPPKKNVLPIESGVNRIVWDMRYQGAEKIKKAKIDAGEPGVGPLAAPGTYTVKLTGLGKTMTVPVAIGPDPRVSLTPEQLVEQVKLSIAIRDDITRLSTIVDQLRSVREQLTARAELLKDNSTAEPMVKERKALIDKLNALEAKLHNPKAEVSYDILAQRGGAKLYSVLGALYDWSQDSDGALTEGMQNVYSDARRELAEYEHEFNALVSTDLRKINDDAKAIDVPDVIVPPGKKSAK